MNRTRVIVLYIMCVLTLASCADRQLGAVLDQAEQMLDDAQYEEAYALLDSIDGSKYAQGSHMQARYALLYTRALYKNYIVSPSDSLISIAVDYAEEHGNDEDKFYAYLYQGIVRYELNDYSNSSVSLIRALANADDIEDAYSEGQMYTYLALNNEIQQCSEEDKYAHLAYHEYEKGGLGNYRANALGRIAIAKLHKQEYDSCQHYLNAAVEEAKLLGDDYTLLELLSAKAQYAVLVDSANLAEMMYHDLIETYHYPINVKILGDLAYLQAKHQNRDSTESLLCQAESLCQNMIDRHIYWEKALWCYEAMHDLLKTSEIKDSLLLYSENRINELLIHSSLAEQRDYSEWLLQRAMEENLRKRLLIIGLVICLLLLSIISILSYKKKRLIIRLQSEKVKKLQLQIMQQEKALADGLQQIKASNVCSVLRDAVTKSGIPHVEWDQLYSLFCDKLPHYEQALRELTPLSETEWRVCMLLKADFSLTEISFLTNKSAQGISSIRRRLYEKVFHTKGKAADWDVFIESIM